MDGAYALVRKSDLSVAVRLTCEEAYAIRTVEDGTGDEHLKSVVRGVLVRAHGADLWLGCDCRREGSRRAVVAPVRRKAKDNEYTYHRRVLGRPQLEHDAECAFYRAELRDGYDREENREARRAPEGFMSVLRAPGDGERLADEPGREEGGRRRRRRPRPALSKWLLRLLAEAGLTRADAAAEFSDPRAWVARIRKVARQIEVAPGRALSEWWFPWAMDWSKGRVQARLRDAQREWPEGYRPQAFLTRSASVVDAHVGGRGRRAG